MFDLVVALAVAGPPVVSDGRDYITTGGVVICTLVTSTTGVLVALIQSNRRLTKRSLEAAETAADRSEPTGNGFALDVRTALQRIERDIGGIRSDQRATTQRVDELARRFNHHLDRD